MKTKKRHSLLSVMRFLAFLLVLCATALYLERSMPPAGDVVAAEEARIEQAAENPKSREAKYLACSHGKTACDAYIAHRSKGR